MGVVEEEAILGDYPSILNVGLRSFILIIIYFLLAKIYQQFPALGFSTKSKGGLNQGQKPNDISYTGAYKTIVITIQEAVAIALAVHHFGFSIPAWWEGLWNPTFGGHQSISPWLPRFLEYMQGFWILGIIHYAIMLDGAPHQIRTWHKIGAVCGTVIGSRVVYFSPGSVAYFLYAAKVPGLIESLLTVAHVRGIFYTKGSVALAVFGTVFNSVMRFIVEPILVWKLSKACIGMATPLDIFFGIGFIGLIGIHLFFSVKAMQGLPKLLSKFKAVQENANKNE